jgi:hypothetical protein
MYCGGDAFHDMKTDELLDQSYHQRDQVHHDREQTYHHRYSICVHQALLGSEGLRGGLFSYQKQEARYHKG